jgi:hypothetical protein
MVIILLRQREMMHFATRASDIGVAMGAGSDVAK